MIKYPFYLAYYKYYEYFDYFDYNDKNIYLNTNEYVKTTNLNNKKFCSLINTHDNWSTRTKIYNILNSIQKVDCPSKLFNNMPNNELNKIGNVNFIKKYLFNICPENKITEFSGYITEKIMNASLGGAIPIYCGYLDDYDKKIFNLDRILIFNINDNNSYNNIKNTVIKLMNNKYELNKFYKQTVFLDTAYETIKEMENNVKNIFNDITESYQNMNQLYYPINYNIDYFKIFYIIIIVCCILYIIIYNSKFKKNKK